MTENAGWAARFIERLQDFAPDLWQATLETIYMVVASTLFSLILGFVLAVFLILTHPQGIRPRSAVYRTLGAVVNLLRSFPFIILLIAILPFTRLLIGTTIGSTAAIVPLTIAAAPFAARLIEACFLEVDRGVVEAARSFGASDMQIVWRVLVPEALPAMILNVAVLAINLLGYSAMAGVVGGGGLGDLAMKYGYYRFQNDVMFLAVVILLVIVQGMQALGDYVYKKRR
jgi:D-methionine transport system permease protein